VIDKPYGAGLLAFFGFVYSNDPIEDERTVAPGLEVPMGNFGVGEGLGGANAPTVASWVDAVMLDAVGRKGADFESLLDPKVFVLPRCCLIEARMPFSITSRS